MKGKLIALLFIVLGISKTVYSQVNLQNGSATFGLSMFNWNDDRSRLNTSVGLSYNSGNGLSVNSVSSNVGEGWNLVAGGVISRVVVGQPDDQKPKDGAYDDITRYPAGYLYNTVNANNGCPKDLISYPIFDHENQMYKQQNTLTADRELDYFSFQVNGIGGQFVLGKNNGDKGVLLGDSKIKVWFTRDETQATQQNCRTTINAFYVQDENGLIYTFAQLSKTKVLNVYPAIGGTWQKTPKPRYQDKHVYFEADYDDIPLASNPYIVNSWYLTNIKDPLTQRSISFNYVVRNINTYSGDDIRSCSANGMSAKYIIISHKTSITLVPEIASIQCPDGSTVAFNYDNTSPRYDVTGDYPLKSVDVKYNNRSVSSYLFSSSYFLLNTVGTPTTATQIYARLCLKSVTKVGVDLKETEPPFIFDYYTGSASAGDFVPPPFYYFKDIFGYYNGGMSNDLLNQSVTPAIPFINTQLYSLSYAQLLSLCFITSFPSQSNQNQAPSLSYNTINPGFAKNGLLKSVTSPGGGKVTYDYEQNTLGSFATPIQSNSIYGSAYYGGIHISKVSQTDGGYSNGDTKPIVTLYKYVNIDGNSSQWGLQYPYNGITTSYYYSPGGARHTLFNGCKYDYTYAGVLAVEQSQSVVKKLSLDAVFDGMINIAMSASSIISTIQDLVFKGDISSLVLSVILEINYLLSECADNSFTYPKYADNYTFTNTNAYTNLNFPTQFGRVEEIKNVDGPTGIGKTVYEFTTDQDYALWENSMIINETDNFNVHDPFSMKQRSAQWAYGLPKKTTFYNANGNIVKQTENIYNFNNAKKVASGDKSCNCFAVQSKSMSSPDWMNLSNPANVGFLAYPTTYETTPHSSIYAYSMKVDLYSMYTGRAEVSDSYERVYSASDQAKYIETSTHYDYNPQNYEVSKITTTHSNGDKTIKEIYYPIDYTAAGVLQTLATNNIINTPVASYSSIIKYGTTVQNYINGTVTDFKALSNGDIKPYKVFESRSSSPVTSFVFNASNPFNYPNLVARQEFAFNQSTGKVTGSKDEGGHNIASIFDYDDKLAIATIINADANIDFPAYTSFETQQFGGWALTGTAAYITTSAITGGNSFNLSGNSLTASSLNTSKSYKLSFWTTGIVNISGTKTLVTSGPTINGFTYYEYNMAQGTTAVTVSGSGNIDELRIYPKNARMNTTTYDPVIGKTSECDDNNRIVYYEYDNLGKLRFVKDEKKNIVKMYERYTVESGSVGQTTHVPNIVYAKMNIINTTTNGNGDQLGDVVVNFFSDAACTQPLYLGYNLTINYGMLENCNNGGPGGYNTLQATVPTNGTSVMLQHNIMLVYASSWQDQAGAVYDMTCTDTYTLTSGPNYIVVP